MKYEGDFPRRLMLKALGMGFAYAACGLLGQASYALDIRDSPSRYRNSRRMRENTQYIVTHTTEGFMPGALQWVKSKGNANYFVERKGRVHRIMNRGQKSEGCGHSMWDGNKHMNDISENIEFEGFFFQKPTDAQIASGRELIAILKRAKGIQDAGVLTHSMISTFPYTKPERGRKIDALFFARDDIRGALGLHSKPTLDPDVNSGRVLRGERVEQKLLHEALYGSWAGMQGFPGCEVMGAIDKGSTAYSILGREWNRLTSVYKTSDGELLTGNKVNPTELEAGTLVMKRVDTRKA